MSSKDTNSRAFWTTAGLIIALDIVTKILAVRFLQPEHVPHPIVGEFVRFTLAYNPGAAFSMSLGEHSRYIFGSFARPSPGICHACSHSASRGAGLRATSSTGFTASEVSSTSSTLAWVTCV